MCNGRTTGRGVLAPWFAPRLRRLARPWRPSGVQTNLRFIVLLACLTLSITEFLQMRAGRDADIAVAKREAVNLSASLAEQAHFTFQAADTVLLGLVERVRSDGISPPALNRLNRLLGLRKQALPFLSGLVILQEQGFVVASGDSGGSLTAGALVPAGFHHPADAPALAAFRHHAANPSPDAFIGRPARRAQDASWVLTWSRRLEHQDGSFAGVAVAEIDAAFFQHLYDGFDIGGAGIVLLANTDGILLVRRPFLDANVGRDLSRGELFSRFVPKSDGQAFTYTAFLDGETRFGSVHKVEGTPLVLIVARARRDVLADWRSETRARSAALGCTVGALLLLGWRLSRQIREREHDQRRLRDSHARLLDAEAGTAEAVRRLELAERIACVGNWRLSLPERTLSWSDEVYRIYGVRRDMFVLTVDAALEGYHPQDRTIVADALDQALRDHACFEVCARILRPGGALRHVMSRGMVQTGPDGAVAAVFGVFIDITDQKAAEAELKRAQEEAAAANVALETMAMQDGLTGLANRRHFDHSLAREFRRAMRTNAPLGLILIDVDNFKQFNDLYGHPSGDACLRAIAETIAHLVSRTGDTVARYGGEEFAVLLPGNDAKGAGAVAEAIARAVRTLGIVHAGSAAGVVTISAGYESFEPVHDHDVPGELVQRADIALYAAKRDGRDTVRWYGETEPFVTDAVGGREV